MHKFMQLTKEEVPQLENTLKKIEALLYIN